jgi:hypothetical protein
MPYVKDYAREDVDNGVLPRNAGELNYLFTTVCHQYWKKTGQNYQAFNDIIGALEGCKLELYRRKVAPYEDQKIIENGDV